MKEEEEEKKVSFMFILTMQTVDQVEGTLLTLGQRFLLNAEHKHGGAGRRSPGATGSKNTGHRLLV